MLSAQAQKARDIFKARRPFLNRHPSENKVPSLMEENFPKKEEKPMQTGGGRWPTVQRWGTAPGRVSFGLLLSSRGLLAAPRRCWKPSMRLSPRLIPGYRGARGEASPAPHVGGGSGWGGGGRAELFGVWHQQPQEEPQLSCPQQVQMGNLWNLLEGQLPGTPRLRGEATQTRTPQAQVRSRWF